MQELVICELLAVCVQRSPVVCSAKGANRANRANG